MVKIRNFSHRQGRDDTAVHEPSGLKSVFLDEAVKGGEFCEIIGIIK